jgi:hypothetical protein
MVNASTAADQRDRWRARLRVLGYKASLNPSLLSLHDLDEVCTLVAKLGPTTYVASTHADVALTNDPNQSFKPLRVGAPHQMQTQARLRQAYAWEYIATQLAKLAR